MLNSLEKLQFVISGLILLVIVGIFLLLGMPDARTDFESPEIETVVVAASDGAGSNSGPGLSEADRAIARGVMDVVRDTNLRVGSYKELTKEDVKIQPRTLRFLKNKSNWMSELDKAGSEIIVDESGRPTAIEIYDIEEGSFFDEFDLQDGDKLLLVDGGRQDFSRSNISHFMELANDGFDRLEKGGTFTVTFLRNGRIVHKEFRVGPQD